MVVNNQVTGGSGVFAAEQAKEAADPAPPVPQFCRLATLQRAGDTIRMEVSFSQGVWGWLSLYRWTN